MAITVLDFLDTESKNPIQRIDRKKVEGAQSQDSEASVQTCRVTYGGVNGAYYTSTRTTRTGADGVSDYFLMAS